MKKCFTLLIFIFLSLVLRAQTYVSGFISANTTWTVAGSPYIVIANALVSQGYTLTIDPGVVVKFDTNCALQVDGQLIAVGTASNRITFTSNQASPKAGDWAKLHFADKSINAVYDLNGNYLSGCILKYCDVLYAGSLGYGAVHIESASPYISQCNILHSKASGTYCNGASFLLDSSVVNDCANYGLYFSKISLNSCGLTVRNDSIENNLSGGLYIADAPGCSTIVKNNYFYSNAGGGAIYHYYYITTTTTIDNVVIADNYFINNTSFGGIVSINGNNHLITRNYFTNNSTNYEYADILNDSYYHYNSYDATNQSIIANYFINNSTTADNSNIIKANGSNRRIAENYFISNNVQGRYGAVVYTTGSPDTVECNLFQGNQTANNAYGAINIQSRGRTIIRTNIFDGNYNNSTTKPVSVGIVNCWVYGQLSFTNNTINNNTSPSGQCLKFWPNLPVANPLLFIDHNNFTNNTANSVVFITGGNTANNNYNFLYMSHNNFSDPNSRYELYNDIPYGSPNMYPDSNYWGSTSTQHVDSVIYDYFDFANKAVVYYQPILTSPVEIDTTCSLGFPTTVDEPQNIDDYSKPFPNPFSTYTTIRFDKPLKDASLLLYNVFGQKVKTIEAINAKEITVSRNGLADGIYIYEVVEKGNRIGNGKLVVD